MIRFMAFLFFLLLVSIPTLAQGTEEIWQAPVWFEKFMAFLSTLPKVGPVLEKVLLILGVISSVLTIVSTAFVAVGKSLVGVLKLAKFEEIALKVEHYGKLAAPYLKYLSMYNVKKK